MKQILVVAHSATQGGAENALKNLLERLQQLGHQATLLVPAAQGEFVSWCAGRGLECLVLPMQPACPLATASLLQVSFQGLDQVAAQLASRNFDLVLTNTAVIPHGGRIAALLKLPHIVYVHELIDDRSEIRTTGIPSDDYLRLVGRAADHLLCCSPAVQARFRALGITTPASVLYPYAAEAAGPAPVPPAQPAGGRIKLLAIGVQSIRKNPVFAVTVLQALRLRGRDVELHVIGGPSTQTPRLQAAVQRRGLTGVIGVHEHRADPYDLVPGPAINLVCASSEPFGLTIPESLSRGIPVVASRSGGPQYLLGENHLFDVGDIDRCVRLIERICDHHAEESVQARAQFEGLLPQFRGEHQRAVLAAAIESSSAQRRDKPEERFYGPRLRDAVLLTRLPAERIVRNIASVAGVPVDEIQRRIEGDRRRPGIAVMDDCRRFDVVPFSPTNTDALYREGVGFAVELASTYDDQGRLAMSAFILGRLTHEASRRKLRVLALGDGIGIDTLRMADAGFDVDYIDFDASLTARVARQNFDAYFTDPAPHAGRVQVIADASAQAPYDAVVCLEVIEHVGEPVGFLRMLSERLAPGGLLFISECFDGVRDHWPTHLQSNEDFSGLLPLMGREFGLVLDDCSVSPFAKPYVLRKLAANEGAPNLAEQLRDDKGLLRQLMGAQVQLGA